MQPSTQNRNRRTPNVRALFDILMGFIYAVVGGLLALAPYIHLKLPILSDAMVQLFGGACVLYGGFRIYRGVKT
ncbi:MAG TPA: hypothetical protein PKE63_12065, partial [Lacibacter sp.]|nr:hypothetical protein [Lacibacter sp.]